ncbi:MAG: sigma factor-like helix-turn-helix DNA-binding protein [Candidatus Hydrogenedentota bacterium]
MYNSDFWEVSAESGYLENLPAERALWFESDEDRERRDAFSNFFTEVKPVVLDLLDSKLTQRQMEVVKLYYLYGKTQEDIATILDLTQSTVSRHLFGTVRGGKKVGGAIPKLRKVIDKENDETIETAFDALRSRLSTAA